MKTMEQTEATAEPTSNSHIELSIVQGDTSGLVKFDEATGTTIFADDLTYEQWKEVLRLAKMMRRNSAIVVADCLAIGIKKWGRKKVDETLEQLEFEAALVKTGISLTGIPVNMRFENLKEDHYVELSKANLPKAKKIYWARIAHEQGLTAVQLRFSMVEGEVVDRAATKMLQTGVITVHGIRQSFDVWSRRVGGLDGVKAMEQDHQVEIMEELDAIVEFGIQLDEHLQAIQMTTGEVNAPEPHAA